MQRKLLKDKNPSLSRVDPLIELMTRRERSQIRGAADPYKDPFTARVLQRDGSRNSAKKTDDGYGSATEQRVKAKQTQS